jgi:magnesium-transporting ATPase (P-type)
MRRFAKDTAEQIVETFGTNLREGLNSNQIASLRKAHGLNKLEEEEKVCNTQGSVWFCFCL